MPQAIEGKKFTRPNNLAILQNVWKHATSDYQRRVPNPTKANIKASIEAMMGFPGPRNEFVYSLVNRIGMEILGGVDFENPLRKFNIGDVPYGSAIEEIQVDLIEAEVYSHERDSLEKDVWGKDLPNVQTSFHTVNRENVYKVTIQQVSLRRAFLSENGLSDFVMQLMKTLHTSNEWDEFLLTCSLFRLNYDAGGFFKVNVPAPVDEATSKAVLKAFRTYADLLKFPSAMYNAAGMTVSADPDDLELFITPEGNASVDVDALAAAFNEDRAAMPMRVTVIPAERMAIPGAVAILTTRKFFVIANTLRETREISNPRGLYDNHFLHVHQIISLSRFAPAILFTSTEPTTPIERPETPVTGIEPLEVYNWDEEQVTSVVRGELFQIIGEAVTTPEGGYNDAVRLQVIGAQSPLTRVFQNNTLQVSLDEPSSQIIVTATAVDDDTISASLVIPITGKRVHLWTHPGVFDVVTPIEPSREGDNITIPNVVGVQYKVDGEDVANGSTHAIPADGLEVTTASRDTAKYQLEQGAIGSWSYEQD